MIMNRELWKTLAIISSALCISIFLVSCEGRFRNKTYAAIPDASIDHGEALARIHCASCHLLPDPSELDVTSWEEGVLPQMGPRLGIFRHNFKDYPNQKNDQNLPPGFYPAAPALTAQEWQYIMDYYLATSPDSMPPQHRKAMGTQLSNFRVVIPTTTHDSAAIVFTRADTTGNSPLIWLTDVMKQKMYAIDSGFRPVDSVSTTASIVDIAFGKDQTVALDIGFMNPTNARTGRLISIENNLRQGLQHPVIMQDSLARPVAFTAADLNRDGATDYVICEFGHMTGMLSWLDTKNNQKHILSRRPGAIKAWTHDADGDGLLDVYVLFAQGHEAIVLFTNKGNNVFEEKELIAFPAVNGSSYFELCDFNKDGKMDILYTCGDNADYSPVLKPYHGVYIYLNTGQNIYRQQFFYPINGCFKAVARDFDNDGDLDIAAISFFADYARQPEEGFVFLEGKGGFEFEAFTFPEAVLGRWLTMDVADIDRDGKPDILLGNFSMRPSAIPPRINWQQGPAFLLLKNSSR
ncbi:MAG: VCBS repeat-containing protein [Chitinophagaceae bacterium]|nr:MAG: VCBS repeat-containing protein [Chitinophagaceae bacterium]